MTDRARADTVTRLDASGARTDSDLVAIEAPLEVLVTQPDRADQRSLGLLMRTPGDDRDLVLGLLYSEGVIDRLTDVLGFETGLTEPEAESAERACVTLSPRLVLSERLPNRALIGTSACGLCGRLNLTALDRGRALRPDSPRIAASVIAGMPATLLAGQAVFAGTGGLHGAALCDLTGAAWLVREDVGRHNAVDKIIGAALDAGRLPTRNALLAVSGRVAYEIVQKAVAAGVAAIVAVGAPSSLAVDAARATNLTLVGFARDGRFNVYSGAERIDA